MGEDSLEDGRAGSVGGIPAVIGAKTARQIESRHTDVGHMDCRYACLATQGNQIQPEQPGPLDQYILTSGYANGFDSVDDRGQGAIGRGSDFVGKGLGHAVDGGSGEQIDVFGISAGQMRRGRAGGVAVLAKRAAFLR